jgi:hypothetical protein
MALATILGIGIDREMAFGLRCKLWEFVWRQSARSCQVVKVLLGSYYEGHNIEVADFYPLFCRFAEPSDDTVMTVAIAELSVTPIR